MTKLEEIIKLCKCSVSIEVNNHRNVYQSAFESIIEEIEYTDVNEDPEVLNKMIELDTIVTIQCYQHTPVGFIFCMHYDLEILLTETLKYLQDKTDGK